MILPHSFYVRDVLEVAPDLLGKFLCIKGQDGKIHSYQITETEAYRGEEDKACHASKGRTGRTEIMYGEGGQVYVYLIYGMYWMLNIVTGSKDQPQAALIRGLEGYPGPGKLTKALGIDKTFLGEWVYTQERIWLEDRGYNPAWTTTPRIGIDYAGEEWVGKLWRWVAVDF